MAEPGILTKEEANAKIAAFVALAYAALADAETLADDYGLAFSFRQLTAWADGTPVRKHT